MVILQKKSHRLEMAVAACVYTDAASGGVPS